MRDKDILQRETGGESELGMQGDVHGEVNVPRGQSLSWSRHFVPGSRGYWAVEKKRAAKYRRQADVRAVAEAENDVLISVEQSDVQCDILSASVRPDPRNYPGFDLTLVK
jgi:hypothetical protein